VTSNDLIVDMTIFHIHEVVLVSHFGAGNIWNVLVKCACDAVNRMYILYSYYYGNLICKRLCIHKSFKVLFLNCGLYFISLFNFVTLCFSRRFCMGCYRVTSDLWIALRCFNPSAGSAVKCMLCGCCLPPWSAVHCKLVTAHALCCHLTNSI
jgi:hypothetical protein